MSFRNDSLGGRWFVTRVGLGFDTQDLKFETNEWLITLASGNPVVR